MTMSLLPSDGLHSDLECEFRAPSASSSALPPSSSPTAAFVYSHSSPGSFAARVLTAQVLVEIHNLFIGRQYLCMPSVVKGPPDKCLGSSSFTLQELFLHGMPRINA